MSSIKHPRVSLSFFKIPKRCSSRLTRNPICICDHSIHHNYSRKKNDLPPPPLPVNPVENNHATAPHLWMEDVFKEAPYVVLRNGQWQFRISCHLIRHLQGCSMMWQKKTPSYYIIFLNHCHKIFVFYFLLANFESFLDFKWILGTFRSSWQLPHDLVMKSFTKSSHSTYMSLEEGKHIT